MVGIHLDRSLNGIEGNVHIGCVSSRLRKYFWVGSCGVRKVEQKEEMKTEEIKNDDEHSEIL